MAHSSNPAPHFPTASIGARDASSALLEEQRNCWEHGNQIQVEDILEQHPELRDAPEIILDLVYNEVLLRERSGEHPKLDEYVNRFPSLAAELERQFEVHRAFAKNSAIDLASSRTHITRAVDESMAGSSSPSLAIPGYEIIDQLGRGGMGVVYRAWQERPHRMVALKLVQRPGGASAEELARLRTEAEALARLEHPNIVQVYEVGEKDGYPFLALQFVDGGSLDEKLEGVPLEARPAAELLQTLALGVHHAHRQGIIHRDLKPSNVLLTACGTPKITDFGLAKIIVGGLQQTQSGEILGTPSYMAPEQACGNLQEIGPATDVYALGAILYEMLTGRPPFRAATLVETIEQVRSQMPVAPARLQPGLPRDLETICLKCLQKEPRKRYASAEALADDLGCYLADRPIRARRTSLREHAWRWCRRNPLLACMVSTVVVLLGVIVVGTPIGMWRLSLIGSQAVDARADAEASLRQSYLVQAEAGRWSGRPGRRLDGLELLRKARDVPVPGDRNSTALTIRNQAIACLCLADLRIQKQWKSRGFLPDGGVGIAYSSKGLYAYSDKAGEISVRVVENDGEKMTFDPPGAPARKLTFSPHGSLLVAEYQPGPQTPVRFFVYQLQDRDQWEIPPRLRATSVAFSRDGSLMVVGTATGALRIYETQQEGVYKDLEPGLMGSCLAVHSPGASIAVGCANGEIEVRDLRTGEGRFRLNCPDAVNSLAWHPQGHLLAAACDDFRIYVWDVRTPRQPPRELKGHDAEVREVAFSNGGHLLASWSWDNSVRLWNPGDQRELLRAPGSWVSLQFSHDDRTLGFTLDKSVIGLWKLETGRESVTIHGQAGEKGPFGLGYSPDARLLASAGERGVQVWDTTTGQQLAELEDINAHSVEFTRDGKSLIVCGGSGLSRYELTAFPTNALHTLQVGPRDELLKLANKDRNRARLSADGQSLAVTNGNAGQLILFDLVSRNPRPFAGTHHAAAFVSLSTNGRWIATGARYGDASTNGVTIWDRQREAAVQTSAQIDADVAFSPDNRWLVTGTGQEYAIYEVGTWRRTRVISRDPPSQLPCPAAFSKNGKLLAIAPTDGLVRLLDTQTWQEIATLEAPGLRNFTCFTFSPKDDQLAVAAENRLIQIFHLSLIRNRLQELQLDW